MRSIAMRPRAQLITVLSVFAVIAAAMAATGGRAAGTSSAAQYEYGAPVNTAAPAVSGTAQVAQTLTTTNGTWNGATPITYAIKWVSCDANGAACVDIAGATSTTYKLTTADVGRRIRSLVTATNSTGSSQASSAPTAPVAQPANKVLQASDVKLPDRLVADKVTYSANPIRSRTTPTQMRVHVSDSFGNSVQGAAVYVIGVPYSRIRVMPEVSTDATGWATLSLTVGQKFPRTGYLVLFVRVRVPGQDVLSGSSTRRLVQVTIGAPTG
jgi:hypothetical protein